MQTCTTIDHVYPATVDGTPCYCGKRRWNQDSPFYAGPAAPPKALRVKVNTSVKLTDGTEQRVVEVDRKGGMFKDAAGHWHDLAEVCR